MFTIDTSTYEIYLFKNMGDWLVKFKSIYLVKEIHKYKRNDLE